MRRAVFLDRDDTLVHCDDVTPDGDLGDPALVRLLPGVSEGVAALKAAGLLLAVASNQGGVARGRFTIDDVERTNARVNALLGGMIDAFRYCPFHPRGSVEEFAREHPWRKPAPGMFLDAAKALGVRCEESWSIGDRLRDCRAAKAAGCRTILLPAPSYRRVPEEPSAAPEDSYVDVRAASFADAVRIVLDELAALDPGGRKATR
ncbi:MAG: HAD-IIIA family hydrolase [Planctomycetota bacterium]|nr:HAD-IIIA family hydrolase [Planctomycetota bacterium]